MNKLTTYDIAKRFKAHLQLLETDELDETKLTISVKQLRNLVNEVRDDAELALVPEPKPQDAELHAAGFRVGYPAGVRTLMSFDTRAFVDHLLGRMESNGKFMPTHIERHALGVLHEIAEANSCLLYDGNPEAQSTEIINKLGDRLSSGLIDFLRKGPGKDRE